MPRRRDQMHRYPVTISDWIIILQEKTSSSLNLQLVFSSLIATVIIGLPLLYIEIMGSNLVTSLFIAIALIFLWIFISAINKKIRDENKPYGDLYTKIIKGQITDPKEILEEYNKIEPDKEKKQQLRGKNGKRAY